MLNVCIYATCAVTVGLVLPSGVLKDSHEQFNTVDDVKTSYFESICLVS